MKSLALVVLCLCGLPALALLEGCRRPLAQDKPEEVPTVAVSRPVLRSVGEHVDFTGHTEAVESVEIRARVTGYLDKIFFKEGAEVRVKDPLFLVDPRPFQASYDQAAAQVEVRQAALADRQAELARNEILLPKGAVTQADFDKVKAGYGEAKASVAAAEANRQAARLNLDFTRIASPIDGRISRANITVGNLVKADETLLTTVVSQDPMYVYFDIDERTMLRVTRMLQTVKEFALDKKHVPLGMGLADEEGFPHAGFVNFADNVVDPSTGTVTARGVFANPAAASGARLVRPGMFVRVRLVLGQPQPVVLVAERALGTDQAKKFLLVVDEQDRVQYRQVELGPLEEDGLRVVRGLAAEERVLVSGLQLVHPKMKVQTEEVPMPCRPGPAPALPQDGKAAAAPRP